MHIFLFLDYLFLCPLFCLLKLSYGDERYEKADFQTRVRQRFAELQASESSTIPWHVVHAGQSMEKVEADIWKICEKVMETAATKPVGKLWMEDEEANDV